MKFDFTMTVEVEAKFLKIEARPSYWEDSELNGSFDHPEKPTMPMAWHGAWCPVIELETGKIVGWPQGVTANVHYKVRDGGRYHILCANGGVALSIEGYVPPGLDITTQGYGDYIALDVAADGVIENWDADALRLGDPDGAWSHAEIGPAFNAAKRGS